MLARRYLEEVILKVLRPDWRRVLKVYRAAHARALHVQPRGLSREPLPHVTRPSGRRHHL